MRIHFLQKKVLSDGVGLEVSILPGDPPLKKLIHHRTPIALISQHIAVHLTILLYRVFQTVYLQC
jgi:hypothetical protein